MGAHSGRWDGRNAVGNGAESARRDAAGRDTVETWLRFQETGQGFEGAWQAIGTMIEEFAGRSLARLGVLDFQGVDPWAVGDVVGETSGKLLQLGRPGARGRFDPARAKPGLSGLRGWLCRIVERQAVDWVREYRYGRSVRIVPETDLVWNAMPGCDEPASFLDRVPAKFHRPDLLPILEACVERLPDPFQQQIVRLKLRDELSLRETAGKLRVPVTRVQRQLCKAFALMRRMLELDGIDEAWLLA